MKDIFEATSKIRKILKKFPVKERDKIVSMFLKGVEEINKYESKWKNDLEKQREDEKQYPLTCCCGEKCYMYKGQISHPLSFEDKESIRLKSLNA